MGPALGQDRTGSGKVPLVRITRKGWAQLCRKDIGPVDLEGWRGREVETTLSCPLGWLQVGEGHGVGEGHEFGLQLQKFKMKDSSPFSHSEGCSALSLCIWLFFLPLLHNFLWMNPHQSFFHNSSKLGLSAQQ